MAEEFVQGQEVAAALPLPPPKPAEMGMRLSRWIRTPFVYGGFV